MNKLHKTGKALLAILKNPWLLNHVINDDAQWEKEIMKRYRISNGLPVIDVLEDETLECFAFLDGGSLATDIALLKNLSRKFKGCSYFEIGTWRGESVVNVADVAKECYTLNLSKQEMSQIGLKKEYIDLYAFFSKDKANIIHLNGDSLTFDYAGLNKKFDLIFIDGNHHYDYIKQDTKNVFKHLVHDDSIVVWHDYAYTPEKLRPEVLSAILAGTPQKFHSNLYHVANTMCAVYMKGDFTSLPFTSPSRPDKAFKVTIERKNI